VPKPVITAKGDTEYEVEMILDSHLHRAKLQYLVKWKGYGPEENSWEPESNLGNSKWLVDAFHQTHPNSPRHIAAAIWATLLSEFVRFLANSGLLPVCFRFASGLFPLRFCFCLLNPTCSRHVSLLLSFPH
jgi:Chromo (CHRromatin Organisation MOdifier) domain